MIIPAVFFGAVGVAIGWYAWRAIVTGKILVGIRGSRQGWDNRVETWFVRREDPVSFWIAVSLVGLVSLGTLFVAVGPLFQNRPLLFSN
jgi:hypothetical protein